MKVIILGFNNTKNDEELLSAEMEKLISESQCFLFYVLCGSRSSAGYNWAEKNGCPVQFVDGNALPQDVDFALVKIDENTPAEIRNYIMRLKAAGKHGRVIK